MTGWAYEHEWRCLRYADELREQVKYFNFRDDGITLRTVYLGHKIARADADGITALVHESWPNATIIAGEMTGYSNSIVIDKQTNNLAD